ncbi:MAG TPA: mechanosensitive ion channel family protein [Methanocorpusculum sp.]|nr:mechanosensitive ion channel family protein [Methanocorpusculum sp.]
MVEDSVAERITDILSTTFTGNKFFDKVLIGEITFGNLIAIAIIIIITIIMAKFLGNIIQHKLMGKAEAKEAERLAKFIRALIYIFGFSVICPQLHINITGMFVTGGAIAIVAGLAFQDVLKNVFFGLFMIIEHPINVGDVVIINGVEGYVEDINLLSTKIRQYDGLIHRITNTTVYSGSITNCVTNVARRFDYHVNVSYTEDAQKAMNIMKKTLSNHPLVLTDPAPQMFVNALGASGIDIEVRIWAPSEFWWIARTELLWKVFSDLRDENIDIPYDQLTIWFGAEGATEKLKNTIESGKEMEVSNSGRPDQ